MPYWKLFRFRRGQKSIVTVFLFSTCPREVALECHILRLTRESRGIFVVSSAFVQTHRPHLCKLSARERNGLHVDLPPSFRRGGCRGFHVTFLRGSIHRGKITFLFDIASLLHSCVCLSKSSLCTIIVPVSTIKLVFKLFFYYSL